MKHYFIILVYVLVCIKQVYAQERKSIQAKRSTSTISVDGLLNEKSWKTANIAENFVQMRPYNGRPAVLDTKIKILFDDDALYFGALMLDPAPDSVRSYLSLRDDMSDADNIGISFNPYDDGIISYHFIVTAAGVQVDMRSSADTDNGFDRSWDAVWESAVRLNELGWVAEIRIPFSALRFPADSEKGWGFNIIRVDNRRPEQTSWNYIDQKIQGFDTQMGLLTGIKDINSMVRLSLTPYMAGYLSKQAGASRASKSFKGGMDLKYGINDSYTLDMMLIPDFGEVESDQEILNLTPYEVYYDEKRQFFTEGAELFNRADIFYSRRIGDIPVFYSDAYDKLYENEVVKSNPLETQIINATKLTGKSRKGLSIGILNAMTAESYATLRDTLSGNERLYRTQPFANYNVFVADQTLKNNSFISLINTNVTLAGEPFGANVTGLHTRLADRNNEYAVLGKGGYSQNFRANKNIYGGYYDISLAKIKGNFQFDLNQTLKTKDYDPNLLGYEKVGNLFINQLSMEYNIFEPKWIYLRWQNSLKLISTSRLTPMTYSSFELIAHSEIQFKNYMTLSLMNSWLAESNNFHEPRVEGLFFRKPGSNITVIGFSTDERKMHSFNLNYYFGMSPANSNRFNSFNLGSTFRLSPRFSLEYDFVFEDDIDALGFSEFTESHDSVFFSKRDIKTLENKFAIVYSFGPRSTLNITTRHYWSRLEHDRFFTLGNDGMLIDNDYYHTDHLNFNNFNIDVLYSWNFSPGSTFSIVYKNAIRKVGKYTQFDLLTNLKETLQAPQFNSISIKVLYYLDYQNVRRLVNKGASFK